MLIFINKTTQVVETDSYFNFGEQSSSQISSSRLFHMRELLEGYFIKSAQGKKKSVEKKTGEKVKSVLFT